MSERAIPLLQLPVPLSRGQYLALVEAGVLTSDAVGAMVDGKLVARIGSTSAKPLIELVRPAAEATAD